MAHPDVALDVQRRSPRKSERLHVCVDERLVHGVGHSPGTLEPTDELLVDGTAVMVDQLDLLVGSVVRIAVVHNDVEAVCETQALKNVSIGRTWFLTPLTPHEDEQSERVTHVNGTGHACPACPVALPDLHVTLGWREREVDRVRRVYPVERFRL